MIGSQEKREVEREKDKQLETRREKATDEEGRADRMNKISEQKLIFSLSVIVLLGPFDAMMAGKKTEGKDIMNSAIWLLDTQLSDGEESSRPYENN